jgi:outer membrane lipoprotein SlyB
MHSRTFAAVALAALGALAGCAHSQSPVLYPNAKLQAVGKAQADADVAACRQMASDYVSNPMAKDAAKGGAIGGVGGAAVGAVAGAVTGHGAGRGAMIGAATGATAGAVHGAAKDVGPTPVYKGFVNRCLRERGYEVVGWQ